MSDKIFNAQQSASANEAAINAAFANIGQSSGGGGGESSAVFPNSLVVLGDSIATGQKGQWFDSLIDKFGIETAHKIAVSQAKWAHSENSKWTLSPSGNNENNIITNQVFTLIDMCYNQSTELEKISVPEVILIHCGINDISSTNGDVDDAFDFVNIPTDDYLARWSKSGSSWTCYNTFDDEPTMQTLAGGMRFALSLLRKNFPYSKIVMTTPLYTAPSSNARVREINEIIKKAASYMSIPVLDLTYDSGIFADNLGLYLRNDGLHPNHRGGRLLADVIGNFLMSQFGKKIYDYRSYDISGTFVDTDGNAISGERTLNLYCGTTYTDLCITCESDGTFEATVPASVYSFKKHPFLNLATVNGEDTVNVSEDLEDLVVKIPCYTMSGTIKDKDGNALANTQVTVYSYIGDTSGTVADTPELTFTTGSGGSYSLAKLPVGKYRLVYTDNGNSYYGDASFGSSNANQTVNVTLNKPV